jgi:hypothetical protein
MTAQAQEQDALSDIDFESGDEDDEEAGDLNALLAGEPADDDEDEESEEDSRPAKKRRA